MKRFILFTLVAICALLGLSAANGQTTESSYYSRQQVAPAPVWNYPRFGYDNLGYHASTYEAGVLSGLGSLYRGVGEHNVANSVAAYNWQLARMANMQNNIVERNARAAVYASVRVGQERRHQENIKKNAAIAAFHVRESNAVLAATQLNRKTGEIKWPAAFQAIAFAADRAAVESALAPMSDLQAVSVSNPTQDFYAAVNSLKSKLEERKDELRPSDYAYAKTFLNRLQNEQSVDDKSLALSF